MAGGEGGQGVEARPTAGSARETRGREYRPVSHLSERRHRAPGSRGERGQTLLLTLILSTVGIVTGVTVLTLLGTVVRLNTATGAVSAATYTAESLLERVLTDMTHGADALPTTYVTGGSTALTTVPFQVTTSYIAPSVTLNGVTAQTFIAQPPSSFITSGVDFVDPGLADPDLQTLPGGSAYLMRLYNVHRGVMQVNWAYAPAGPARVAIWRGIPLDPATGRPVPPGRITALPQAPPLTERASGPSATSVQTLLVPVEQDVYTVVFDNTVDASGTARTTGPFQPSGLFSNTWLFVDAHKDYLISITAANVTLAFLVRQVPGFAEPPSADFAWSPTRSSFIRNQLAVYSWGRDLFGVGTALP